MIVCHFTLITKPTRVIKQTFPACRYTEYVYKVKHYFSLLNAPTLSFHEICHMHYQQQKSVIFHHTRVCMCIYGLRRITYISLIDIEFVHLILENQNKIYKKNMYVKHIQ